MRLPSLDDLSLVTDLVFFPSHIVSLIRQGLNKIDRIWVRDRMDRIRDEANFTLVHRPSPTLFLHFTNPLEY